MKLKVKKLNFSAGRPVAILDSIIAERLSINISDRIQIHKDHKKIIAVIDLSSGFVRKNEIALSSEIVEALNLREKDFVSIELAPKPISISLIKEKLDGHRLTKKEIEIIIKDIVSNSLTEAEVAFFVSSMYKSGMSMKEIKYLTKAMKDFGKNLELNGKIIDKHSVGGVPGNRTTPIIVSILASIGLIIPKTSSRAITTAAGTADTIEAIAQVEFSVKELKKIIKKTNACIVWGGTLGLAPADDRIIQIERLLNLDPNSQLLASIVSKKLAVGADYILIDIPYGKTAKVKRSQALILRKKFEQLGRFFRVKIKAVLTDGKQPIGNGIGPVLEIKDILAVLRQEADRPLDLEKKSLKLASLLLELSGKVKKDKGLKLVKEILKSGKAFEKFQEIIKAQKGSLKLPKLAKLQYTIRSKRNGKIQKIDNKKINYLARLCGAPADKGSGLFLHKHLNDRVKKREEILTFYSESKDELKQALSFYKKEKPIKIK